LMRETRAAIRENRLDALRARIGVAYAPTAR